MTTNIDLTPMTQSVRDARARLWELDNAQRTCGLARAALITWVPRDDDPNISLKQGDAAQRNKVEIEREADKAELLFYPVTSVPEAAERVCDGTLAVASRPGVDL